ncbi:MAG: FHA domain-containing protein [Kofleriaceae bacterium]
MHQGSDTPQSTDQQPRALGPRAEDAEAPSPPVQLRVMGDDVVLPLDAGTELFWLGSGPDVHLHLPRRYVSRRHASLRRLRGKLDVANHSSNGTRVDGQSIGDAILGAADTFEVGATTLLILDEPMVRLRGVLARAIGFGAHAEVDRALVLAMRQIHVPLILTGPRGAESERLAAAIHQATPRRSRPFQVIDACGPGAAVAARLRAATGGTVFVDVRPLQNKPAAKSLVTLLGDPTFRTRLIIGATTSQQVRRAFDHDVSKLGEIRTPPVLARVPEIPALLDAYLAEAGSPHSIEELPDDRVEALRQFAWPENLEEIRRAAERLAAFFECDKNISATARQLGLSPQTLSEWFDRVGVVPRQRRR